MNKYHKAYMDCAKAFANCSTAGRLKVGCILVKNDSIIAEGLNGTPPGHWTNECEVNGKTARFVIHAEMNAILKAAKNGSPLNDSTMYVTHSPCPDCAKHIKASGIKKVVYNEIYSPKDSKSDGNSGIRELELLNVEVVKLC